MGQQEETKTLFLFSTWALGLHLVKREGLGSHPFPSPFIQPGKPMEYQGTTLSLDYQTFRLLSWAIPGL